MVAVAPKHFARGIVRVPVAHWALLAEHLVVGYIQLAVAAAVVFAPAAAVFDAAVAAARDVCAVVGECVHVAQAGAYAEVSRRYVRKRAQSMETFYSRA
jgi:formaldehyde-activating enzyme involved in methanogenesis